MQPAVVMVELRPSVSKCLLCFALGCSAITVQRSRFTSSKVDVVFAADLRMLTGAQAAVASVVDTTHQPKRLRVHIVVCPQHVEQFQHAFGLAPENNKRTVHNGASLQLHKIDTGLLHKLQTFFPTEKLSAVATGAPSNVRRWWVPSNFVRFYIDTFLPSDSDRAVWMDADTVAQHDVADLADALLLHPSKSIAFARYPTTSDGFSGSYRIIDAFVNQSWARLHLDPRILTHPVWNAGVLAFNVQQMRRHQLRNRALDWIKLNKKLRLYDGGSQTPLDLAALTDYKLPATGESFLEVESAWNCWWGFLGLLKEEKVWKTCKIIHFADKDKPWAEDGQKLPAYSVWLRAKQRSHELFATGINHTMAFFDSPQ